MSTRITGLRADHHRDPLGIGADRPRLSWRVDTDEPGWVQAGYEIALTGGGAEFRTGRVDAAEQVLVAWPAVALTSRARRAVRVRVWGPDDQAPSAWSDPLCVEAGLLEPDDWTAQLVGADLPRRDRDGPAVLLRREFELPAEPVSARLYATAHGVYELELNGERIGDHVLAPGWTSYHHRLRYQTFDVTGLLQQGRNAIGGWLGEGWYAGRLGFGGGHRHIYGAETGLAVQLEVLCADGRTVTVTTDRDWRTSAGPITAAGLYDGERYDARAEQPGWSAPGFDDRAWTPVACAAGRAATAGGAGRAAGAPDRVPPAGGDRHRTVRNDHRGLRAEPDRAAADPGARPGGPGDPATPRGGTAGRRTVRATAAPGRGDRRVHAARGCPRGVGAAVHRSTASGTPRSTGWPGELTADDVEAVVCHTDMVRTGWFSCSEPLLNRLHENVVWSMRSNFLDIPTDCPQRDERLGWTGDLNVFAPTATFLYDCTGLISSWLADLAAEQAAMGTVPHYVPWVPRRSRSRRWPSGVTPPSPCPPWVYDRTGDTGLLRAQYESMRAWVDQVTALAGPDRRWGTGLQLGDWLDPTAPPDKPYASQTDRHLVATAAFAGSARTLARVAALLGEDDDQSRYAALAAAIVKAFGDEYVTPTGRLVSDAQTAYALALTGDLLGSEEQRARAGRRLTELVEAGGYHVGTGFVGTPLICDALTVAGAPDTAYHLVQQQECPSWLYPVTMGATTVWERWDSMLPDGTVNPGEMTSFNHYAFGAVADWLHRTVAGLAPAAPGYRRVHVRPQPGGGLTHASATHDSPYGRVHVVWSRDGGRLDVDVTVPPGVTAKVQLPDPSFTAVDVGAGRHHYTCDFRPATEDPKPVPPPPFA